MTNQQIDLTNIGPIEHLKLDIPPGAITVLKGPNGSGKSTALNAIDRVVTGKKSKHNQLSSRDGTTGGAVDAYGVRLKISRGGQNRTSGECIVESVEGDLNIADFVDPNIKSPEAADARRIKALVVLTGAEADESMFHELVGGRDELREIVPASELEDVDVLDMAGKIKRGIEKKARTVEGQVENVSGEIRALQDSIADIDFDAPHDADELEDATETAREVLAKKRAEFEWFEENAGAYTEAKNALAAPAPDRKELEEAVTEEEENLERIDSEINELRKKLTQMEWDRDLCQERIEAKKLRAQEAERAAANRQQLQSLVSQFEARDCPGEDEIAAAENNLSNAKAARDRGVEIRAALGKRDQVNTLQEKRQSLERYADSLRNAARGTEDVLAEIVKQSCPRLRVDEEFRLQIDHPKRGACYFAELSEGERWRVGIEIAIEVFKQKGQAGLLQIPQSAWEGLDGRNRAVILDAIKGTELAVVTAEATREEDSDGLASERLEATK